MFHRGRIKHNSLQCMLIQKLVPVQAKEEAPLPAAKATQQTERQPVRIPQGLHLIVSHTQLAHGIVTAWAENRAMKT